MAKASQFLGKMVTRGYTPTANYGMWLYMAQAPRFSLQAVSMMEDDPRVAFGLWLIKGPILSKSRFFIESEDVEVKEYLKKILTRFWRNSAIRALKAVEWGFSCCEATYRVNEDNQIVFDSLKDLHPPDCRPVHIDGKLIGTTVRNVPVPSSNMKKKITLNLPRCLWHIHGRERHPWYGRSRLRSAYLPWIEKWTNGGYRDSRRLFFHKYAYQGGVMYHPPGTTKVADEAGQVVEIIQNRDLARNMMDKMKTGGTMELPNTGFENGAYAWQYNPPAISPPPTHVMEYGKDLNDEIWEGMGIPPEIARAEGTGAYAGRAIPLEAFYAILSENVHCLISDADEQLFRSLVEFNFGPDKQYEIVPFGLTHVSKTQDELQQKTPPGPLAPQGESGMEMSNSIVVDERPELVPRNFVG